MAAPHVSAMAAIVKDKHKEIHVSDLKRLLKLSTTERNIVSYEKLMNNLEDDDFKIVGSDFKVNTLNGGGYGSFGGEGSGCGSLDLDSGPRRPVFSTGRLLAKFVYNGWQTPI